MRRRRNRPTPETPRPRQARDRRPRPATIFPKRLPTAAALPMPGLASPAVGRATPGMLAAHVLRDGEAVLLVTRPSLWFIVLASWRWVATGVALLIAAAIVGQHYRGGLFAPPFRGVAEAGVAAIAGRLMWASLQWMGRLYVLTDLRLVTIAGVLRSDVLDCPLRRVARTRLCRTTADRAMGIGTVEAVPADPDQPTAVWQHVARPAEVYEQVVAALTRAQHGGGDW